MIIPVLMIAFLIAKLYSNEDKSFRRETNIESIEETKRGIINTLNNSPKTTRQTRLYVKR